jgi:hypothetical protein
MELLAESRRLAYSVSKKAKKEKSGGHSGNIERRESAVKGYVQRMFPFDAADARIASSNSRPFTLLKYPCHSQP